MVKNQQYSIIENFTGANYNPLLTYNAPEIKYGDLTNNDPTDDILLYKDTNIASKQYLTQNNIFLNNSNNTSLLTPVSTRNSLSSSNNLNILSYDNISSNTPNTSNIYHNTSNIHYNTSNIHYNTSNIHNNTSNIHNNNVSSNNVFNVFDKKDNNLYKIMMIFMGFSIIFIIIFLIYVIYMFFFYKEETNNEYIEKSLPYNDYIDKPYSYKNIQPIPDSSKTPSFLKLKEPLSSYNSINDNNDTNISIEPIKQEINEQNNSGFLSRFFGFDKTKQTSSLKDETIPSISLKEKPRQLDNTSIPKEESFLQKNISFDKTIPLKEQTEYNKSSLKVEPYQLDNQLNNTSMPKEEGFLQKFLGFNKPNSLKEQTEYNKQQPTALKVEPYQLDNNSDNVPLTNKTPEKGFLSRFFGKSEQSPIKQENTVENILKQNIKTIKNEDTPLSPIIKIKSSKLLN